MRVDQLIPAFHRGDAIGDTASHLKRYFRSCGFSSEIFRLDCDKELEGESEPFSSFPAPSPQDVTILHYALPSPLTQGLITLSSKKFIIHHNITPPEFFAPYSLEMMNICLAGRRELESLAPYVDLALADSEFNRQELLSLGFKRAEVFPLFVDFTKYERPISRFFFDLFRDGRTNVLFVGRIVPNKKIEDLIKVIFYYKKYISPLVRLVIVGKTASLPNYYQSLIRLADEFYLKPEEICFTGHISDEEMYALYRASDVSLSLSEHEGFCLPLVESMVFDLPIVAFNSTAVPYTLDGAGILINHKRVDYVAELVEIVAHNAELREKIIQAQRQRLERFKREQKQKFLFQNIENLLRQK
jgi:glycosyltransferase involved in cell wall biosynthesis